MKINIVEEVNSNIDPMLHIYPSQNKDYSVLSVEDKAILDVVIAKFKNYKAAEIVEYMHEEKAYKETSAGDIIPFSIAKEIRALS